MYTHVYMSGLRCIYASAAVDPAAGTHTCHILPPSEIDLGLFWADFTDLEGKHLFHRIG